MALAEHIMGWAFVPIPDMSERKAMKKIKTILLPTQPQGPTNDLDA